MVRFAHLADCHLGAWRNDSLRNLTLESFSCAIDICIEQKVSFIIIAGDLFHTAIPRIDVLKTAARCLQCVSRAGIPVYVVPGSHDYSPTGRTILDVFEEAGLLISVCRADLSAEKIVLDPVVHPSGISLVGLPGKAAQLDSVLYERLDIQAVSSLCSPKIFVFHAALDELTPKNLRGSSSSSVSLLPQGFDYYAGGHVHLKNDISLPSYGRIAYPGPTFPASFSELESLHHGSFLIADSTDWSLSRIPLPLKKVVSFSLCVDGLSAQAAFASLSEQIAASQLTDCIVLIRVYGTLSSGSGADISFQELFSACMAKGAFVCLKNTFSLSSQQFTAKPFSREDADVSVIENTVFSSFASDDSEKRLFVALRSALSQPIADGETKSDYEQRIISSVQSLL